MKGELPFLYPFLGKHPCMRLLRPAATLRNFSPEGMHAALSIFGRHVNSMCFFFSFFFFFLTARTVRGRRSWGKLRGLALYFYESCRLGKVLGDRGSIRRLGTWDVRKTMYLWRYWKKVVELLILINSQSDARSRLGFRWTLISFSLRG